MEVSPENYKENRLPDNLLGIEVTVTVKKEEWDNVTDGISEAAWGAGLYDDHQVKDELVIGPEEFRAPGVLKGLDIINTTDYNRQQSLSDRTLNYQPTCIVKVERQSEESEGKFNKPFCSTSPQKLCENKYKSNPTTLKGKSKQITCRICNKQFVCKYDLNIHLPTHNAKPNLCGLDKTFAKENELIIQELNHKDQIYFCDKCNRQYTNKDLLSEHIHTVHEEKSYLCKRCNINFASRSARDSHELTHTGKKRNFTCPTCHKSFAHNSALLIHTRIHTGHKPFACGICGRRFTQKNDMARHERVHTGKRPFPCDTCHKKFKSQTELKSHKRVHTGEKNYPCEICEKSFRRQTRLTTHIRLVHAKEKRFACSICDKRFGMKIGLDRHYMVHTGEKPFTCDICHKSYQKKYDLTNHKMKHTGQKFSCKYCEKQYAFKGTLVRHERSCDGKKTRK